MGKIAKGALFFFFEQSLMIVLGKKKSDFLSIPNDIIVGQIGFLAMYLSLIQCCSVVLN